MLLCLWCCCVVGVDFLGLVVLWLRVYGANSAFRAVVQEFVCLLVHGFRMS